MNRIYLDNPYKTALTSHILEGDEGLTLTNTIAITGSDAFDDEVLFIDGAPFSGEFSGPARQVELSIDGRARHQLLQDQLGRLLLTMAFSYLDERETISWRIGHESSRIVVAGKEMTYTLLHRVEELVEELIASNLHLEHTPYDGMQTFVKIGRYDPVPTEGPLPSRTAEATLLLVEGLKRVDDGIEITFSTGRRARKSLRDKEDTIQQLSRLFQTTPDALIPKAKQLLFSREHLQEDNKKMQEELGHDVIQEYLKDATILEDTRFIYKVLRNTNFQELKRISTKMMDMPKTVQIYGMPHGAMGQILVCISRDLPVNLKDIFDDIKEIHHLTGGGNLYRIQANCPTVHLSDAMEAFLLRLKRVVEESAKEKEA